MPHASATSRRRTIGALVMATPLAGAWLAGVTLAPGPLDPILVFAALSPYGVAGVMLAIVNAAGAKQLERPTRPERPPALVGEVLPPHPARIGAKR